MHKSTETPAFSEELLHKISESPVIAVLVIDDADNAVALANALLEGGVTVMELTMRTEAALPALEAIRNEAPDMICGAGTVLTRQQVEDVSNAGAEFAVAPGLNPRVVKAAREIGLSFAPGVMTATEVESAVELGCRLLKFFPAEPAGGLEYLKSMAGPYAHLGLKYIPLGGLNTNNAGDYLSSPLVAGIGGSWIAKRDTINACDWRTITANAKEAVRIAAKG